jgi:hypothetical protein
MGPNGESSCAHGAMTAAFAIILEKQIETANKMPEEE